MEAIGRAMRSFHEKHEKLKHTVHTVSIIFKHTIACTLILLCNTTTIFSWMISSFTYCIYTSFLQHNKCYINSRAITNSFYTSFAKQYCIGLEISTPKMGTVCNGMLLLYNARRGWMVCNAMGNIKKP